MDKKRSGRGRKWLLTLAVAATACAVLGAATFATFNAQTKNPVTFANGTLVLSNKVGSGTACLSTAGGATDSNSATCDAVFNLSVRKPGDQATSNVTLKNEGSLNASALGIAAAACSAGDAGTETYHGTGNPCSKIQVYVQKWSDSGFSTPQSCVFGGTSSATTCDFSDASKTLDALAAAGSVGAGGLSAGSASYFTIGVKLPSDANNSF